MVNERNKEVIEMYCGWRTECSWKCALTWHSCISVTDKVQINEQNTSIATGPLYTYTPNLMRFERSYLKLLSCGCFEPHGVSDLVTSALCLCKTPKYIFTQRMVQYIVLKIEADSVNRSERSYTYGEMSGHQSCKSYFCF